MHDIIDMEVHVAPVRSIVFELAAVMDTDSYIIVISYRYPACINNIVVIKTNLYYSGVEVCGFVSMLHFLPLS